MDIRQRAQLVASVTRSEASAFYRKLYGSGIGSIQDEYSWRRLPFVTKEILLASPLSERMYAPLDTDHLRASSGTSGKGVLFSPRTYLRDLEFRFEYHSFDKPILSYLIPTMPHWNEYFQKEHGYEPGVIVFDPKHPRASIRLAKQAGVDSITTFAFHAPLIGALMTEEGMYHEIRYIELGGEKVSGMLYSYLRSTFPNATLIQTYGSSEVEDHPMGIPCHPLDGSEPLAVYHKKKSQYHELLDPLTDEVLEPEKSAEGELIISAYPGEPCAFPLLRYRTGDMVRVVEERCPVHGERSFTVLGRVAMDFLKVPGGMLRTDEVERVLRGLHAHVTDEFQLHRYEQLSDGVLKTRVVLAVERTGDASYEELARVISESLRVNPVRTYAQGVTDGLYLPLVCQPLEKTPGVKHKRMVAH